jgi:hypothetical protein
MEVHGDKTPTCASWTIPLASSPTWWASISTSAGTTACRDEMTFVVTLRDTDKYKRSFGEIEVEFVPYFKLPRLLDKLRGTAVADDSDVI